MAKRTRSGGPGRNIKRKYPRTEILKVRMSKPYKKLIEDLKKEYDSEIVSDADIVEWALQHFGSQYHQVYVRDY